MGEMREAAEEEEEEIPSFGSRAGGRSRECRGCRWNVSLGAAVRILFGMSGMLLVAVAVLGALVFRKVDSISEEISSSQSSYEQKILSIQEDLQGLGQRSSANSSELHDAAALSQELSELRQELQHIQAMLQAQEILLERTSRSHARLSAGSSAIAAGLENCSASLGNVNRSLERLREQTGSCRGVAARLEGSLQGLARERWEAGMAAERLNSSLEQNSRRLGALRGQAEEEALALRRALAERQDLTRVLGTLRVASSRSAELLRELQAGLGAAAREASRNSQGTHELALELLGVQLQLDNIWAQLDESRENLQDLRYQRGHRANRTAERFGELESRVATHGAELATIAANVEATDGHVRGMLRFVENARLSCAAGLSGHAEELEELRRALGGLRGSAEELRQRAGVLGARLELGVRNISELLEEMRAVDVRHGEMLGNASVLRGIPGLPGPRGSRGDVGSRGFPGIPGAKGDAGILGSPGPPGAAGSAGIPGPRGDPGSPGSRGSPGSKGAKGSSGIPGPRGAAGATGGPGLPGAPGAPGKEGSAGLKGKTGIAGRQGKPGRAGEPGEKGEPGMPGEPGAPGEPGMPGAG